MQQSRIERLIRLDSQLIFFLEHPLIRCALLIMLAFMTMYIGIVTMTYPSFMNMSIFAASILLLLIALLKVGLIVIIYGSALIRQEEEEGGGEINKE